MEKADMDGTLEPAADRWRLRFTRRLKHPPDTVWRALTEPEHLQAWFPQRIVGEWAVGAPLRFVSDGGEFDGEVLALQPPSLIEFRWGTDIIRLELAGQGEGSVLTLLDTFGELGKAARDAAGWHVCLDALEHAIDGKQPEMAPAEGWRVAHRTYVEQFGPQASTIGPPEVAPHNAH
jgi:uncharacterized protein YndB with AHSA1/START domain